MRAPVVEDEVSIDPELPRRLGSKWVTPETALVGGVLVSAGAVLLWPGSPFGAVVTMHVIAYACFVALVLRLRSGAFLSAGTVWSAGLLLLVLAVVRPPLQSHDLWSYAFYGRIVSVHHRNPYVVAPSAFPRDPMLAHVDAAWRNTRSVYGALFTGLSALLARLAGSSALMARLLFQGMAAAAVAAAALLVHRSTRSVLAAALLLLNPLVVLSVVNGGHNDALVGLGVLASVLLVRRGHPRTAALAIAAAVLVKISALVVAVVLLAWIVRRHGTRIGLAAAMLASTVMLLGTLLAGGATALKPLTAASRHITSATLWKPIDNGLVAEDRGEHVPVEVAQRRAGAEVMPVAAVVLAVALGVTAMASRRATDVLVPAMAALGAVLILGTYVLPWYLAWGLPLVALARRSSWTWLVLVYGGLLHLAYIPHYTATSFFATGSPWATAQEDLRTVVGPVLVCLLGAVFLVLAARPLAQRRRLSLTG